jgi:hypothetical protein
METEILRLLAFLESGSDEKQEFAVTADQVFEYVKQHGLPESLYEVAPSRMDGTHLTEVDGLYVVYEQERDLQDHVEKFSNKEDAIQNLTLRILKQFTWAGLILLKNNTYEHWTG